MDKGTLTAPFLSIYIFILLPIFIDKLLPALKGLSPFNFLAAKD